MKIAELLSKGTALDMESILKDIKPQLEEMGADASIQVMVMKLLHNPPEEPRITKLAPIMAALFPEAEKQFALVYSDTPDQTKWTSAIRKIIESIGTIQIENQVRRDIEQAIVTNYIGIRLNDISALRSWTEKGGF